MVKRTLVATAVSVAAVCVGLALVEAAARLALPEFDPSGRFEFGHVVGTIVLGKPNSVSRQVKNTGDYDVAVRINNRGLRDDKDIASARRDGLIVVGDSMAWGWGVEEHDRFSNLIQTATGIPAFNLAIPTNLEGYGALLEYAESLGAEVGRVVLAVTMENDLRDYGEQGGSPPSATMGNANRVGELKRWLAENSTAYVYILTVIHQTPWLQAAAVRLGLIVPNLEGIAKNAYSEEVVRSSAAKIQALARRYRMTVVLIPSRALWAGNNRDVEDRVHKELAAALRAAKVDTIDLRPVFEAGGTPLAYHFGNDGHWNPLGHRLAADAIVRGLR